MAECIFCAIAAKRAPVSLVHEDAHTLAFLDIHPARPGHVLVVPRRHAVRLGEVGAEERARLFELAHRVGQALRAATGALRADDVHLLVNDGPAANQTVAHVHVHVVPRRRGDLGRLLGQLVRRPIVALTGGPPRSDLDWQAGALRALLTSDGA
jgi:histidine triad (HIT) family protein